MPKQKPAPEPVKKDTVEQTNIYEAAARNENIAVGSLAGVGKTSVVVKLMHQTTSLFPKRKNLAVAFNVKAKEEIISRLGVADPKTIGWDVLTFNGLGFRSMSFGANKKFWGVENKNTLVLEPRKVEKLVKSFVDYSRRSIDSMSIEKKTIANALYSDHENIEVVVKAIDYLKNYGFTPQSLNEDIIDRALEDLSAMEVNSEGMKKHRKALVSFMRFLLTRNFIEAKTKGVIDFADQIYLSVLHNPSRGYQWGTLIVDEGQDMSALNHRQIINASKDDAQTIIVGDKNQALYGFRGAIETSMETAKEKFKLKDYPLSVTFRCPKSIVAFSAAHKKLTNYKSFKNEEGIVDPCFTPTFDGTEALWATKDIIKLALAREALGETTVVIARTNALLTMFTASLALKKNSPSILCMFDYTVPTGNNTYTFGLTHMLRAVKVAGVDLPRYIANNKATSKPTLTLTTVHRVKGLEYDNVFILAPERMAIESNEEACCLYVAQTRASKALYQLQYDSWKDLRKNRCYSKDYFQKSPTLPFTPSAKSAVMSEWLINSIDVSPPVDDALAKWNKKKFTSTSQEALTTPSFSLRLFETK
jgi:superfamily I DNA/RNA helicase